MEGSTPSLPTLLRTSTPFRSFGGQAPDMYYVYILLCSDQTYYVGLTENIKKRIKEHKSGLTDYTKYRLPIKIYWIGIFRNKKLAANFEQYLKTGSGNAFFKKRFI